MLATGVRVAAVVFLLAVLGAVSWGRESWPSSVTPPVTSRCTLDDACPAIDIAGDPFATLGADPAPFRGYGDPDLAFDSSTGTLWLTYRVCSP